MRPSISGKLTALLLVACLAVAAIVLPLAAHMPRWIEFELVLGVWWVVWWIVLGWVLFHRMEVEDDAEMPRGGWLRDHIGDSALNGCGDYGGCSDAEGCGTAIAGLIAIVAVALAVLFVIELLIPAIAFLLYLTVRAMLRQAARWHERCEGNPGASMFWAAVWSTVYLAPIGLVIWGVQLITRP
jgi:hypothetical protein